MTDPNSPQVPGAPLIDVNTVFAGVFQDPSLWAKLLPGSGLLILCVFIIPIPFVMPVVLGWAVRTTRNAAAGEPYPMAQWTEWGDLWKAGAKLFVVMVIYSLPLVLMGLLGGGVMLTGFAIGGDAGQTIAMAGVGVLYLSFFVAAFLGLLLRFTLFPLGQMQVAVHDSIASGLSFSDMWVVFRANPWSILFCGLISYVGGFLSGFAIYCCVLPAFPLILLTHALVASGLGQALWQINEGSSEIMEPASL